MAQKKPSLFSNAMQYGAMTGIGIFIITVIVSLTGMYQYKSAQQLLTFVILILGIVVGIKSHREHVLKGKIRYSEGLGAGTLIAFFTSVIIAFFTFLFIKYVDSTPLEMMAKEAEQQMIEKKYSDEQIELSMKMVRKFQSPLWIAFFTILWITIVGFVISLIASAFLKKGNDTFEDFVAENQ
jgi:hypothetical protein